VSKSASYSGVQKTLHWTMALLITLMLFAGQFIDDPGKLLAEQLASRGQHGSGGVIVGLLLIWRLVARLVRGGPDKDPNLPRWQQVAVAVSHMGMYLLIGLLVVTGLVSACYATHPFELPLLGGLDIALAMNSSEVQFLRMRDWHELVTQIAMGFVAVHVIAALYHGLWLRDGVMRRMLPGR